MTIQGSPMKSVDGVAEFARNLGYAVLSSDYKDLDGTYVLDIEGYGEVIEVTFRYHPVTGFLRFHHGFIHDSCGGGDKLTSTARVKSDLKAIRKAGDHG